MSKNKDDKEIKSSLKLLFRSSIIVFIGVGLSKIFSYLYRIIIAREFGSEAFGFFSLALVVTGLFGALFSFGLNEGMLRYVSLYLGKKKLKKARYLFSFGLKTLFASGLIASIILFLSAKIISTLVFHNENLTIFLQIFSIAMFLGFITGPYLTALRALEFIGWHSFIFNILQNLLKFFALMLFIFLGLDQSSIAWSYLFGILIMFLASYYVCNRKASILLKREELKINEKKEIRKEVFSYSWPFVALSISAYFATWIDSIMVGFYKTVSDVGVYNVGVTLAGLFFVAPQLFIQLFFPLIVREFAKKKYDVVKELSKQVSKWIFILNVPLLAIVLFFPGVIINLLFGPEYLGAANSLRMLSIGLFFLQQAAISRELLNSAGKSTFILINFIIISILNALLNFFLVPKYGIGGAAFSTMLSYFVLGGLYLAQAKKEVGIIPLRKKMLNVGISVLISAGLFFIIQEYVKKSLIGIILSGISFILIYILLMFITRSFDRNDNMIIETIKKKFWSKER